MKQKLSNLASTPDDASLSGQQEPATLLFADICGSTRLFERHGDVRARQITSRVLDLLAERTVAHQGQVIKTIGDEIMSRFSGAEPGVSAACEMQKAIKEDAVLAELNIAIKIGVHHGSVLVEGNDVFGDAVNVAARMVQLSKADQIITTRETVGFLPIELRQITRSLGRSRLRGKQDEMEIVEVVWSDSTSVTQLSDNETQKLLRNQLYARLVLNYRGQVVELAPSSQTFTIGRDPGNNLVVQGGHVSRSHAAIEFQQGKFILKDHSANGTYLLLDSGARFFVRREEFTLHEQGVICLGQAVTEQNPDTIQYACRYVT